MTIYWKGSPNFDSNRKPITTIVIHWFGIGTLESANSRFQNSGSGVSAHYGISGQTVYKWVEEDKVAYHAGNYEVNQRSIGIEHDATGSGDPNPHNASDLTYQTSIELIKQICQRYNIPVDKDHLKPHNAFKATQCSGTVDIDRIISGILAPVEEEMTDDQKRALEALEIAKNQFGFGNLEATARTIPDSLSRITQLEEQVKNLNAKIHDQDILIDTLEDRIAQLLSSNPPETSPPAPPSEFTNPVAKFFYKLAIFAQQ